MTTGQQAEQAVASYLSQHGYKIIDRNWRNKLAEIDIIARQQDVIFFIEVKYRSNPNFGAGLEYITPKKIARMRFASEMWVLNHKWLGDYQLMAASVAGANFEQIEIIEIEV